MKTQERECEPDFVYVEKEPLLKEGATLETPTEEPVHTVHSVSTVSTADTTNASREHQPSANTAESIFASEIELGHHSRKALEKACSLMSLLVLDSRLLNGENAALCIETLFVLLEASILGSLADSDLDLEAQAAGLDLRQVPHTKLKLSQRPAAPGSQAARTASPLRESAQKQKPKPSKSKMFGKRNPSDKNSKRQLGSSSSGYASPASGEEESEPLDSYSPLTIQVCFSQISYLHVLSSVSLISFCHDFAFFR